MVVSIFLMLTLLGLVFYHYDTGGEVEEEL